MRAWILTLVAAACGSRAEPLDKAILGEWQFWCGRADGATSCLGKDPANDRWTFRPNGTLATIEHAEFDQDMDWKLERATLRRRASPAITASTPRLPASTTRSQCPPVTGSVSMTPIASAGSPMAKTV